MFQRKKEDKYKEGEDEEIKEEPDINQVNEIIYQRYKIQDFDGNEYENFE